MSWNSGPMHINRDRRFADTGTHWQLLNATRRRFSITDGAAQLDDPRYRRRIDDANETLPNSCHSPEHCRPGRCEDPRWCISAGFDDPSTEGDQDVPGTQ